MFVGLNQLCPVGQVRFDVGKDDSEAVVDISVDKDYRGQGYGKALLMAALEHVFGTSTVGVVHAYVKSSNEGSIRTFEAAGFRFVGQEKVEKDEAHHFVFEKSA